MLFVLTGDVQIGKSRWLERAVDSLRAFGVESYGVISAGVWIESDSPRANNDGFEKLGIDSILLPEHERFHFAQRSDLAKENGSYVSNSQAGQIGLGWHIDDDSIERVNEHFAHIATLCDEGAISGFLVVDELGRLELTKGMGLTDALALLERGATNCFEHALVVVRSALVDIAVERLSDAWGGAVKLAPGRKALESISSAFSGRAIIQ